jgi:hypothetical protein
MFLGTTYQNGKIYQNDHKLYQKDIGKIYEMAVK